jgi:uncharacterized protein
MMTRCVLRALVLALASSAVAFGCGDDDDPGDDPSDQGQDDDGDDGDDDGGTVVDPTQDPNVPLSSMIAVSFVDGGETGAKDFAGYTKALVQATFDGTLPEGIEFPLAATTDDTVRAVDGLSVSVVASWLDPLTDSDDADAPRFGSNTDYLAYFGDGWDEKEGAAPQFNGSDEAGYIWANHEYMSNDVPTVASAPTGQHLTLAQWLLFKGVLENEVTAETWSEADLETYIDYYKKQLGGSWFRIVKDAKSGAWSIDTSGENRRYDATDATLLTISGYTPFEPDHDDTGAELPEGVAVGIMGDCAGGTTPWGTVITAEENVQDYYGDLEETWDGDQKFVPGSGFDPGGKVSPDVTPSESGDFGQNPNVDARHNRDLYGYLSEIDVGAAPDEYEGKSKEGVGHKKLGYFGRARWEAAGFVVDENWQLIDGQPIVMYSGDDRRGGRLFKWVSAEPFQAGMSRAEVRTLLDTGILFVAHFADLDNTTGNTLVGGGTPTEENPGQGQWIELSLDSEDVAPNAEALGQPGLTVGEALQDPEYNGIGAFTTNDDIVRSLFTVSAKIGIRELNRPEDVEWRAARDKTRPARLFVAFTNHTGKTQIDQDGVLFDPAMHDEQSPTREDTVGAIFALAEDGNPATSTTFTFADVFHGSEGDDIFNAGSPDNLLIDADGDLWFGTDGNLGTNGHADAVYYLDLDPAHQKGKNPTFGRAFRVVAVPADAESTGPTLSSGSSTLFLSVQHPGEELPSMWPPR